MIPPPSDVSGGAPGLQLPTLDGLTNQTAPSSAASQPTEEKKVIAPPPNLQPQSPPTFDQLANHVQSGKLALQWVLKKGTAHFRRNLDLTLLMAEWVGWSRTDMRSVRDFSASMSTH